MASVTPFPRYDRAAAPVSRPDVSVPSFGQVIHLDRRRAPAFDAWFKAAFAAWLRVEFRQPEQVAVAFGVRTSTAWTWWNGENRASGDAVMRAMLLYPSARAWFADRWERDAA
jgi:hypothetical protein